MTQFGAQGYSLGPHRRALFGGASCYTVGLLFFGGLWRYISCGEAHAAVWIRGWDYECCVDLRAATNAVTVVVIHPRNFVATGARLWMSFAFVVHAPFLSRCSFGNVAAEKCTSEDICDMAHCITGTTLVHCECNLLFCAAHHIACQF